MSWEPELHKPEYTLAEVAQVGWYYQDLPSQLQGNKNGLNDL
jgi:hypothetical protein